MDAVGLLTVWLLVSIAAVPAAAQTGPAQKKAPVKRSFVERGFVTLNGAAQAAASDLTDRLLFEANAETGSIEARYPGRTGLLIEAAAGMRVRGRAGVALAVSRSTTSGRASVMAHIPHPFFDDRHRRVDGEASGISRIETAVHLQLYYDLRPRGPWRVRAFAGPTYFDVEQEVVTAVQADETFPFDTATFGNATTGRATGSGIGFNAGADMSRMLTRRVGAGVMIRYARGSVDLNAPGARHVSTDGGGLQAGAGVRLLF